MEIVGFLASDFSQKRLVAATDVKRISSHVRQELFSTWLIGECGHLERIFERAEICSGEQAGFVAKREVVRPRSVRMRHALSLSGVPSGLPGRSRLP